MDVSMNPGSRVMDVYMNPGSRTMDENIQNPESSGEISSQEVLLSENEYLTITKELPQEILDDIGISIEAGSDFKNIGMDYSMSQQMVAPDSPLGSLSSVLNHHEGQVPLQTVIPYADTGMNQSPTGQLPSTDNWPGDYNFEVLVDGASSSKKTWLFSFPLKKIFVDVNQSIPLQFKVDRGREVEMLLVRVVAIYNVAQHQHVPVNRCPNHLKEDKDRGLKNIHHVVQCRDERAMYEYDSFSKRFSVIVPLEYPPAGSDVTTLMYCVTCKGSCAGGMNRRPVTLIFTLERMNQQVVGRQTLNIRVCSCPRRDKKKEEAEKREETGSQMPSAPNELAVSRKKKVMTPKPQTPSILDQPQTKKRKNPFSSSCDDVGESQIYSIQVTGTKCYMEMLKHAIRLKTCEAVKTSSLEAWRAKEEYEEILERVSKGSSS